MFFRPPEATQMNEALDQVSRGDTPPACSCSWPPGGFFSSSVSARPLGEEVRTRRRSRRRWRRKSGSHQEKDEEGLDMTGVSLITRFSRRCSWIYLLSMEGTKGTDWTSHGNRKRAHTCVCVWCVFLVLCFFCGFIIAQFPIPSAVSWRWPFTISPSGSYIHDRYRERKALCRKQICHRAN